MNSAANYGGALHLDGMAAVTITSSAFDRNAAGWTEGGAVDIFNFGEEIGEVIVRNCSFHRNRVERGRSFGGGLYIWGRYQIDISLCDFRRNAAAFGGAVAILNATATGQGNLRCTLSENRFRWNNATAGGALMISQHPSVSLDACLFDGNAVTSFGGGVYHDASQDGPEFDLGTVQYRNCTFRRNDAMTGGAVLVERLHNVTVQDCSFDENAAEVSGAAIDVGDDVSLDVADSSFSANSAGRRGGALHGRSSASLSLVRIRNSVFQNCRTSGAGGGILLSGLYSTSVIDSTFRGNEARRGGALHFAAEVESVGTDERVMTVDMGGCSFLLNEGRDGGAIAIAGSVVMSVRDSSFSNNSASRRGAGMYVCAFHGMTLESVSLSNNTARQGGALYLCEGSRRGSEASIRNSLCEGNVAQLGGCLWASPSSAVSVENVTMSKNRATESGGAVFGRMPRQMRVDGCTFEDNAASSAGGAIFVEHNVSDSGNQDRTRVEIRESSLQRNEAVGGGGALRFVGLLDVVMADCIVQQNSGSFGAAIRLEGGGNGGNISRLVEGTADAFNLEAGAIAHFAMQADLDRVLIRNNTASFMAGAIFVFPEVLIRVRNSQIVNNSAMYAGGIYISESAFFATDVQLDENSAEEIAGALLIHSAEDASDDAPRTQVHLRNVGFTSNTAGDFGGALYMEGPRSALQCLPEVAIEANMARFGGGFMFVAPGTVNLTDTSFVANLAEADGGALAFVFDLSLESEAEGNNLVFEENEATVGAAILIIGSTDLTVTSALRLIFQDRDPTAFVNLTSAIFIGNEARDGCAVVVRGVEVDSPSEAEGPSENNGPPLVSRQSYGQEALTDDALGGSTIIEEEEGCRVCVIGPRAFFGTDAPSRFINIFDADERSLECDSCTEGVVADCPSCLQLFLSFSM